jgi:thiol-disulfide isomerase/thioredoxin
MINNGEKIKTTNKMPISEAIKKLEKFLWIPEKEKIISQTVIEKNDFKEEENLWEEKIVNSLEEEIIDKSKLQEENTWEEKIVNDNTEDDTSEPITTPQPWDVIVEKDTEIIETTNDKVKEITAEEFKELLAKKEKFVLEFYQWWWACSWCDKIAPKVENFANNLSSIPVVKMNINYDDIEKLYNKYNVPWVPAMMLFANWKEDNNNEAIWYDNIIKLMTKLEKNT